MKDEGDIDEVRCTPSLSTLELFAFNRSTTPPMPPLPPTHTQCGGMSSGAFGLVRTVVMAQCERVMYVVVRASEV